VKFTFILTSVQLELDRIQREGDTNRAGYKYATELFMYLYYPLIMPLNPHRLMNGYIGFQISKLLSRQGFCKTIGRLEFYECTV